MASGQGSAGNVIAAVCSFFIPGLGQLVQGKILLGLFFLVSVPCLYWFWWFFIIPAIAGGIPPVHSILDADPLDAAGVFALLRRAPDCQVLDSLHCAASSLSRLTERV